MDIFKGQNLLDFSDRFQTNEDCKKYLAGIKWQDGFKCRKCGHKKTQDRKDFSRTCNICSHQESATTDTLFHKVKFGVRKAYFITFELGTSTKSLSARSLQYIFVNHISREAKITTDKWRGYRPIAKAYHITQIESNSGLNFKALHTMIHQIKSWIRTTYSWVSDFNINGYFNEFCFRVNRSQSKATIFNNLIKRMVKKEKVNQNQIICN